MKLLKKTDPWICCTLICVNITHSRYISMKIKMYVVKNTRKQNSLIIFAKKCSNALGDREWNSTRPK